MKTKKDCKDEVMLAFNHDAFAERCRRGLVDDREFYQAVERNADRELRALRASLTYVVR